MRRQLSESQRYSLEKGEISVSKMADKLGLTLNQIYHVIYRDGIKIPKVWFNHFKMPESSINRAIEIHKMRESGFLIKEIAAKYGISQGRTSEILKGYTRIIKYRGNV